MSNLQQQRKWEYVEYIPQQQMVTSAPVSSVSSQPGQNGQTGPGYPQSSFNPGGYADTNNQPVNTAQSIFAPPPTNQPGNLGPQQNNPTVPGAIGNLGAQNVNSGFSTNLNAFPQIAGPTGFNPETQANSFGPNPMSANQFTQGSGASSAQTTTQDLSQNNSVSAPVDTLGLGPLVQQTAGNAAGIDQLRNQQLEPLASGTSPQYGANTGQQIAQAVSGPQAIGAGNEANIRNASTAATNASNQNAQNLISANTALGTPSTNAALANATPYLGSQSSNTANQLSTGLANAINENFAVGAGPTSTTTQSSGGGGSVICTALVQDELFTAGLLLVGAALRKSAGRATYVGYRKVADMWLQGPYHTSWGKYMAKEWANYISGKRTLSGFLIYHSFYPICWTLGRI